MLLPPADVRFTVDEVAVHASRSLLLSIVIVIVGLVALKGLPISQYPEISPPTVQVTATYPGANAQTLAVRLTFEEDSVILVVQDDGLGFDVEKTEQPGHFGLSGMRERAQLVGGTLKIDSQPGKGTIVKLVLKGDFDESDHL